LARGATWYDRLREMPLLKSTAVADRYGNAWMICCWIDDPSDDAKYFSSEWNPRLPYAEKTPGFFLIVVVARCSSSSFSSTEI
jgi:hypothetical protein